MTTATEELRKLMSEATPGPWEWGGYPDNLKLQTVHHGKLYVMDFVRKGMRGAQPRFQPTKRGMVNAEDLLMFHVGDHSIVGEKYARSDGSVYRYDVRGVDAPDARLIAMAPTIAAELITARETLEEWKASQHYSYIGADGKTVKARDLEDELITARAKLEAAVTADQLRKWIDAVGDWDVGGEEAMIDMQEALAAWEAAK